MQRLFSGLSGIRVGWSMFSNRLEDEMSPASAGPPSGGRAASLTPLSPWYSTGLAVQFKL